MRQLQLAAFLADLEHSVTEDVKWPGGLHFEVAAYVTARHPPIDLVGSVRAIVLKAGLVLVVNDPTSTHILPGGRIEAGERDGPGLKAGASDEQREVVALNREIGEETGWTIARITYLGFLHYHLLLPAPTESGSLDPDFLQTVYGAEARQFQPDLKEPAGYELDARFESLEAILGMTLTQRERIFLDEALDQLGYA